MLSDGMPDCEQSNVVSFYDVNAHYVTMAVATPGVFTDVVPISQENAPENIEYPYGLFSFQMQYRIIPWTMIR